MIKKINIGSWALLGAGFLYALQAIFPKYLSNTLGAYETVTLRFGIAFIIVCCVALYMKGFSLSSFYSNKKNTLIYSIAFPVSAILFTIAVFHTKVSLAIFSFYIANVLSSFAVSHYLFKDKIHKNEIIALILLLVSLLLFTNPFQDFSLDLGFCIGLLSGIIQTIAITFQKKIKDLSSPIPLIFLQTGISFFLGLVFILITKSEIHISLLNGQQWIITILYGLSFALVSFLLIFGFKRVSMSIGVVLISSELVFGPILAYLWFFEKLTSSELLGGIAVIGAIIFSNKKPQ